MFDKDWAIATDQKAVRWFSRACTSTGRLTTHRPCGPGQHLQRKTVTREEYIASVYSELADTTGGCYFSPNLFYGWRRQASLQGFAANWLEIDIAGHDALDDELAKEVLHQICRTVSRSGLPMPTSLVRTGSGGLHLYWMYEQPVYSQSAAHGRSLLKHWRVLSGALVEQLEAERLKQRHYGWAVDKAASNNPTGLMRLPSSVHGKTGNHVEYLRGGDRVSFGAFASQLGLEDDAPLEPPVEVKPVPGRKPKPRRTIPTLAPSNTPAGPKEDGKAQGYDSPGQQRILRNVMTQWEAYLERQGVVQRGMRDLTVFHLYNSARRVMTELEAWEYIQEINDKYVHLSKAQLESYLSSASKQTYFYGFGRLRHILLEEMGLPLYFPKPASTKPSRSADSLRRAQSKAGRDTASKRHRTSLESLINEIRGLCASGRRVASLSAAEVLRHSELTRATFYRYWEAARAHVQKQEIPLLADVVEVIKRLSQTVVSSYSPGGEKARPLGPGPVVDFLQPSGSGMVAPLLFLRPPD